MGIFSYTHKKYISVLGVFTKKVTIWLRINNWEDSSMWFCQKGRPGFSEGRHSAPT